MPRTPPFRHMCRFGQLLPRQHVFVYRSAALPSPRSLPSPRILSRRYSTAAPEVEEPRAKSQATSDQVTAGSAGAVNTEEPKDPREKELEEKKREIVELKDRYLRSVADFQNLQSRTAREVAAARDYAVTGFAKDLLESVDNLDRALSTVPEAQLQPVAREDGTASEGREAPAPNAALIDLYNGLKMTEKVLLQTFARHGLERHDPAGEIFNPDYHEASFASAMPGKKEGSVFSVLQRGYTLNGRVIRAAKVGVVRNA